MPAIETSRARWLFLLLAARLVFHALYIPAYEGPDEPFHLGRAAALADAPWREGLAGDRLSGAIVGSVRSHPCGPDLQRAFGCPPFHGDGAFDLLAEPPRPAPDVDVANYEAHQPPLFYVASGAILRACRPVIPSPERRLLTLRFLSVALVLIALAIPIRRLARGRREGFALGFLLFLLLPGAAESLARGSNDAALFLWAAFMVEYVLRRNGRPVPLVLLLASGPLVKLTAFPIVAVVVTILWLSHRRATATAGALGSLLVFGVQAFRGWAWGVTYELNRWGPLSDTPGELAAGLLRSVYTFVKTVFWLGEWSFFRAPTWLVVLWFAALLFPVFLFVRRGNTAVSFEFSRSAHQIGALVASAGFFTLAVLNRRLFGAWGGLGGWYVWGWAPWLGIAVHDVGSRALPSGRRGAIELLALFVLLANVFWFRSAISLYGI